MAVLARVLLLHTRDPMAINSTRTLAAGFRTAAADGKITDREVIAAIRRAGRNTLTGAERKALGGQLALRADKFEAGAKVRLSRFVAAASKPADSADPRVMAHDRGSL